MRPTAYHEYAGLLGQTHRATEDSGDLQAMHVGALLFGSALETLC